MSHDAPTSPQCPEDPGEHEASPPAADEGDDDTALLGLVGAVITALVLLAAAGTLVA
jgi:hypothetical protein